MKFRTELERIVLEWTNPAFMRAVPLPQAVGYVARDMFVKGVPAGKERDAELIKLAIIRFESGEYIPGSEESPE